MAEASFTFLHAGASHPLILFPLVLAGVFFADLLVVISRNPTMFVRRYGRRHRVSGAMFLVVLILGMADAAFNIFHRPSLDLCIGIMGVMLTLTAAYDFKGGHAGARIKNKASGTLDVDATVTFEEMLEHAFYQGLNLAQIMYVHTIGLSVAASLRTRLVLALLVALPWTQRSKFPVHSFSKNYTQGGTLTAEALIYRVKKWQYLLYKHALLHGLNASLAVSGESIGDESHFRLYWMSLNTAYVMEFFLQSLVKRGYLAQQHMLLLNRLLMLVSTVAALQVLYWHVSPWLTTVSLVLNFVNRHNEVVNASLVLLLAMLLRFGLSGSLQAIGS